MTTLEFARRELEAAREEEAKARADRDRANHAFENALRYRKTLEDELRQFEVLQSAYSNNAIEFGDQDA